MHDDDRAHLAWFVGDAAGAHARFRAVLPHLAGVRVTLLTVGPVGSAPPGLDGVVELPWTAGVVGGVGRRSQSRLRTWFVSDRPDLLVVDGGPEVARAARAEAISTIHVRRPGASSGVATSLLEPVRAGALAPYPALLEGRDVPRWLRERTVHTGLLSRYAGRVPRRRAGRRSLGLPADAPVVTVVCGRDGLGGAADLAAAAAATPTWTWVTVGRCGSPATGLPSNLHRLGWREDVWPALEAADVVVGSGSLSVVAEAASARRPLLVVPRPTRVDDEVHGRLLEELGAATVVRGWPEAATWERLLSVVAASDVGPLVALDDGRGPARAADWLVSWALSPPLGAAAGRTVPAAAAPGRAAVSRVLDLTGAPVHASGRPG